MRCSNNSKSGGHILKEEASAKVQVVSSLFHRQSRYFLRLTGTRLGLLVLMNYLDTQCYRTAKYDLYSQFFRIF